LLSNWFLLLAGIPVLIVLSSSLRLLPVFSVGDAAIRAEDIVLFAVTLRVGVFGLRRHRRIPIYTASIAVAVFFCVLSGATLLARYRLGTVPATGEWSALLRMAAQASVSFLLVYSMQRSTDASVASKVVDALGFAVAGTVYFSLGAHYLGLRLGEVQVSDTMVRAFGYLGDQVGFILVFFVLRHLSTGALVKASMHTAAIVATGTVGALAMFFVGLALWTVQAGRGHSGRLWRPLHSAVVLTAVVGILTAAGVGGVRTRLAGGLPEDISAKHRSTSTRSALRVAVDHPVTGVGFLGVATAGNQYLQVAADGGMPALASFFLMVAVILRTLRSAARSLPEELRHLPNAGYLWFLSLLIGNQTAVWLLPDSLISYLLWIILGWTLAAHRLSRAESGAPSLAG
jgi:hypothetical protein